MRKRGVQYATAATRRVPMYDAACAAKVAEHIAHFYGPSTKPCDCEPFKRLAASLIARKDEPGFDSAAVSAMCATTPECLDTCASRVLIPFDAMSMIEERCGRYTRGAHKGELRGWASIKVVTEGGWKKHSPGERNGRVVRPGAVISIRIGDDFSGKTYVEVE